MIRFLIFTWLISTAQAGFVVKQTTKEGKIAIESVIPVEFSLNQITTLKSLQEFISEKDKTIPSLYEEIYYPDEKLPPTFYKHLANQKEMVSFPVSEVRKIIYQGRDANRITITILGDGYTMQEKTKFFADVDRMVEDMFQGPTFRSYLKVFNVYAIFTPSEESGISDLTTKRTVFDLYRSPRGSKRGIMPGNRVAIEKALSLIGEHTDYPIIIANDDYYGGLGGRYAITTRSLTSGTMVLRHELGHNFSNVGEEYDGGQVYSGANFSSSKDVPWKHWINGAVEVHEAKFLTGSYVWQDLSKEDFVLDFDFPNANNFTYDLKISSVGWSSADDVKVFLNGQELELDGVFTEDRSFFKTKAVPLSQGKHQLKILDNNRDGDNVLAYANGYAYPKTYNFKEGVIGAFNVFDENQKQRGYRPMYDQCLMQDMRSLVFCPIDQENIWIRFLSRINLIDNLSDNNGVFTVVPLDLDRIEIKWFVKSRTTRSEIREYRNQKTADLKKLGKGTYEVEVSFINPEIRLKTDVTTDIKEIKIK